MEKNWILPNTGTFNGVFCWLESETTLKVRIGERFNQWLPLLFLANTAKKKPNLFHLVVLSTAQIKSPGIAAEDSRVSKSKTLQKICH